MKPLFFILGCLFLILMSACSGLAPTSTPASVEATATDTLTPTIIWFPPTNTPTIFPTPTILPTQDQHPGIGDLLFTDTFGDAGLWSISRAANASAIVNLDRLVLTISGQGPVLLVSQRSQPSLGDFYAEVDVTLNLCGGKDQYGVDFRAAPGGNDYRFAVSCDGMTRVERSISGSISPLNEWLVTGDAPIGAPAELTLGVWAVGGEMRFFINSHYQFTVRDPVLHEGTIGFYVYATAMDPITASFSNLTVYSVSYASPTPSLTPSLTPVPSRTPSQ
jgi:hypothetical protein